MKKLFILLLTTAVANTCFCQQQPATKLSVDKEKFLHRAKTEKTVAWIMTGAGAAVIVATAIHASNRKTSNNGELFNLSGLDKTLDGWAYASGGALVAGGGVLFLLSSSDKKKAEGITLFLRTEPAATIAANGFIVRPVPAAGLRITL